MKTHFHTGSRQWCVLSGLLGVVLGTALQLQQAVLLSAGVYGLCLVLGGMAAMVALYGLRSPHSAVRRWSLVLGAALALAAWGATGARAVARASEALPAALEGQDLALVGVVASLPQLGAWGEQFVLAVESAQHQGVQVQVPQRVRLSWRRPGQQGEDGPEAGRSVAGTTPGFQPLVPGQRWRLTARLKRPHGNSNPHGFDAELWLWEQGLRATGQVSLSAKVAAPELLQVTARYPVERWRDAVREQLYTAQGSGRASAVIAALVLGDQAAIDSSDWEVFRRTGVAHLISVSGTHITMFAVLAVGLVGWSWRQLARWWPGVLYRVSVPVAALWGGVALAAAYAVFSGWAVPAQRTVWMLLSLALLRLSGKRWPWPVVWLLVMAVVVLLDPWALLQPGFWLSFVAVGVLFATGSGAPARHWRDHARALLGTQATVTVALAPLTLLLFGQASAVGLLANLWAIPWVTLVVTPGALLGVVFPWVWGVVAWAVDGMLWALQGMSAWPWAVWQRPALPLPLALLALAGAVWLVLRWPWHVRAWGVCLLWPALAYTPVRPAASTVEVLALDVGQGTAVLVRTQQHTLLYDTGPVMGGSDAGQRTLLPELQAGAEPLSDVVLSHSDNDHTGGAASVLAAYPQARLWASFDTSDTLGQPHTACTAGQRWVWDGVVFEFLHPQAVHYTQKWPDNAMSCVLRIRAGDQHVLLTGDLLAQQEAQLLQAYPDLRATLLLAPHHGSKTSSSSLFLQTVRPHWTVFQAGYRNRYGHPAPAVLARYDDLGLPWVSSPTCGAALWRSVSPEVVDCWRSSHQRYWRSP